MTYHPNNPFNVPSVFDPVGVGDPGRALAWEMGNKAALVESSKLTPSVTTEPIIGYRVWKYYRSGPGAGYLKSAYKSQFAWPKRRALTKDVYQDKGIHAVKDYKHCINLLREYCQEDSSKGLVYYTGTTIPLDPQPEHYPLTGVAGSIYMWGEVKEHEIGYLSEYAYPKELFVGAKTDVLTILQLEEDYGVPVSIRDELTLERRFDEYIDYVNLTSYAIRGTPGQMIPLSATITPGPRSQKTSTCKS